MKLFSARISLLVAFLAALACGEPSYAQVSPPGSGGASVNFIIDAITPTIQNATYLASYSLGGLQTVSVFSRPAMFISSMAIEWDGGEKTLVTAYVFDRNPLSSTCLDNGSFVLNSADAKHLVIPPILFTPTGAQGAAQTFASNTLSAYVRNMDTPSTGNIYICFVVGSSVTPAIGDFSFKMSGAYP